MSFFADIVADSRRKIRPTHRPGHRSEYLSGSLPVDIYAPKPFVSEPVKYGINGNAESHHNATEIARPETSQPAMSSRSHTPTTPVFSPSVSPAAEKNAAVLKDSVSSRSVLAHNATVGRLNAPAAPTVQLNAAHKTQSDTTLPKLAGHVSAGVNARHDEIPTSVAPLVEMPFTSPQTALQKQHARKHDVIAQVPAISAKLPQDTHPEATIDQSGIAPEVADSGITGAQPRQGENNQRAETSVASAVMVGVQVEASATQTRQVKSPVGSTGQSNATSSKQPRVQIGQVNVVIEHAAAPRRRTSAVAGNDDYASRNFLKSL